MLSRNLPRLGRAQRGLSLVEMMVGVAIGLIIVAAAALVISSQLLENRKLITETQLQQDLRAASDIVTRELRRAGIWGSTNAKFTVWFSGTTSVQCNQYTSVSPTDAPDGVVTYRYWRSASKSSSLGFKVDNGVLRYSVSNPDEPGPDIEKCIIPNNPTNWQDLTDARTVKITKFEVTPTTGLPVSQIWCPKLCSDGTRTCWPTLQMRELAFTLEGTSAYDPTVKRSLSGSVRLRNDFVKFNDSTAPTRACPT